MAPFANRTPHAGPCCTGVQTLTTYRFFIFALTVFVTPSVSQSCQSDACRDETWDEDPDLDLVLESTESSFVQTFIELHPRSVAKVALPATKVDLKDPAKSAERKLQQGASEERSTVQKEQENLAEGAKTQPQKKGDMEKAGPPKQLEQSETDVRPLPEPSLHDGTAVAEYEVNTAKLEIQEPDRRGDERPTRYHRWCLPLSAYVAFWTSSLEKVSRSGSTGCVPFTGGTFSKHHLHIAVGALLCALLILTWIILAGRDICDVHDPKQHSFPVRHLVDQVLEPKTFDSN